MQDRFKINNDVDIYMACFCAWAIRVLPAKRRVYLPNQSLPGGHGSHPVRETRARWCLQWWPAIYVGGWCGDRRRIFLVSYLWLLIVDQPSWEKTICCQLSLTNYRNMNPPHHHDGVEYYSDTIMHYAAHAQWVGICRGPRGSSELETTWNSSQEILNNGSASLHRGQ